MTYVTHARTSAELKAELLSDLNRRMDFLEGHLRTIKHSEAEKARIARALNELKDMHHYWANMEIIHGKKRTSSC